MPRSRDDDDFEDEAPRRRRNRDMEDEDDFGDEPRRRTPAKKGVNILGIISIVVGILGLLISLIPCIGFFVGLPIAVIGLLLGVIGLFVGKESGRGLPITGSVVSFVAVLISVAWFTYGYFSVKKAQKEIQADMEASRVESEKTNKISRETREKEIKENNKRELDRLRTEIRNATATVATAVELIDDFTKDKAQAERKYLNRIVEVSITVSEISEQRPDNMFQSIRFKRANTKLYVACSFQGHIRDELKDIKVGDTVIVRGKLRGIVGTESDTIRYISIGDMTCTVMSIASDRSINNKSK